MTATVRIIEPTQITTYEEVVWTKTYADYPASLWQLNYYFRGPGVGFNAEWGTEIVADGDDFVITVPSAKTDNIDTAGFYKWQAWLTEAADSTNKKLIGEGRTRVVLRFKTDNQGAIEMRSANEIILDAIKAAISGQATEKVLEYEITTPAGSRKVKRMSMKELLEAQTYYTKLVSAEWLRERGKSGKSVIQTAQVVMYDK